MHQELLVKNIRSSSRVMIRHLGLLNNQFSMIGSTSICHALIEIDAEGVMMMGELSQRLNLEKSTTSRLVAQMIDRDICFMQPDENDRRNKLVSLTKKGKKYVQKIHIEAKKQVVSAINFLSEEEKHVVMRGLSIYANALKRSDSQRKYKIRKLHLPDVPQLINLTKTIWAEFGFDRHHPDAPHYEEELGKIHETYSAKNSGYFVIVHGRKILGGAGFGPLAGEGAGICELKGMYLSNQFRGHGLGALLLQHVLQEAKKLKFKKCYLETMDFMHGANHLYQKMGFVKLDKPKGKTGHHWTNCWYIKDIIES